MTTLKLDPATNDLVIEANQLVVIRSADEVEQRLRARLRMFRGEWFLDLTRGVPFRQEIFVKGVSPERIEAAFKREILRTSGVLDLRSYDQALDYAQRRLTVTFEVLVTDGEIIEITEAISA